MHAAGLKRKLTAGVYKQITCRLASGHRCRENKKTRTRKHARTHDVLRFLESRCVRAALGCWCVCVCMFVRDMLRCDSVRGARWFPKQAVSLTEGLFVKENTGKNLSTSNDRRGEARGREGR